MRLKFSTSPNHSSAITSITDIFLIRLEGAYTAAAEAVAIKISIIITGKTGNVHGTPKCDVTNVSNDNTA